jgi:GT2 family glycosyltransferase
LLTEYPLVVISILNWNGWQDTLECLESVRKLSYPNYLIVVIDNGSWDGSAERIKAWARENLGPGHILAEYAPAMALHGGEEATEAALERTPPAKSLVLIRNDENLGFTGGNNVGIDYALHRRAAADYVFLFNNDAVLDKGCLSVLVGVDREADAGVVGAVVTDHKGAIQFARSGTIFKHFFRVLGGQPVPEARGEFWESSLVSGAAMLLGSRVLRSVRQRRGTYLNDSLFMYGDELDFCTAAHREGYKAVVARNAIVRHRVKVMRQGTANSAHSHYYSTRNRVILSRTLLPLGCRLIFHLFYPPRCVKRVVGCLLARKPRLAWAIACGLGDGYRGVGGKWKYHDQVASWADDKIASLSS